MARTPTFKIARSTSDMLAEQRKPQIQPETGWWKIGELEPLEIPFEGAWGNAGVLAGVTHAPASFYLDSAEGEVRYRGVVDGGGVGEVIFVMPEEARPEYEQGFTCRVVGGGTANITVNTDGEVILESLN